MRTLPVLLVVLAPALAFAGGIEIDEQSPRGVATAGAQGAVADDPSAIFYNPAGLGFQKGLGAMISGNVIYVTTDVKTPATTEVSHASVMPDMFVAQRLGSHFAVGIGGFSNMAEHFDYPHTWPGRFVGTFVDIGTLTINPTVAIRLLPHVSIAGGLDIVPAWVQIRKGLFFGGGEGDVVAGLSAVGFGGNAGLLIDLLPQYLRFGFSYRSRVNLDLDGHGAINAPPELQAMTGGLQVAAATLILPHNFDFALASSPVKDLTLSLDVRWALWSDLQSITLTLINPAAPAGTPPTSQAIQLSLKDSWDVRVGAEYHFLHDQLRARLGWGYVAAPLPLRTLGPLLPDTDRILVSGGLGYRWKWLSIDAAYMAVILLTETSENPDLRATYSSVGHVISLGLTARFENFGKINNPAYR